MTDGTDAHGEGGCQTGLADGMVEDALTQERDAADADEWTDFDPIASTNTTRTLTGDDFRRGFVMTRTGANETHDFSAPSNATVCADREAFGAAEDWIYIALTNWTFRVGTNEVSRFRVFSFGQVDLRADHPYTSLQTRVGMDVGAAGGMSSEARSGQAQPRTADGDGAFAAGCRLAPLRASLGVVPRANWPRIAGNANAANENGLAPSRFWHFATPSNTLLLTWQNVLLGRRADAPVTVQMELWPSSRFAYRYGLARCGGRGATALPKGDSPGRNVPALPDAVNDADANGEACGMDGAANADPAGRDVPVAPNSALTNVLVGASLGGPAWTTNALPTNVTSLAFHPLTSEDAANPDRDGDGLSLLDELFVHSSNFRGTTI